MKKYIFFSGILLISGMIYGQFVRQQSSLLLTGSDVKREKIYPLCGDMSTCNTTETKWHKNQGIPSGKVKAIAEFNSSCMSKGLWVGSVVLAGTANKIIFREAWGYTSVEKTVELSKDAIFDMGKPHETGGNSHSISNLYGSWVGRHFGAVYPIFA